MDSIEILVHVTAPSRAKDDQQYRKQAAAFLDYEKGKQHTFRWESNRETFGKREAPARKVIEGNETPRVPSDERIEDDQDDKLLHGPEVGSSDSTGRVTSTTTSKRNTTLSLFNDQSGCSPAAKGRPSIAIDQGTTFSSSFSRLPNLTTQVEASRKRKRNYSTAGDKEGVFLINPGSSSDILSCSQRREHVRTAPPRSSRVLETPLHPNSIDRGALPPLLGEALYQSQRPRTAPSTTMRIHSFRPSAPLRRSRSATDSFETPPSVIPDSQTPSHLSPSFEKRLLAIQDPNGHGPHEIASQESPAQPGKRVRLDNSSPRSDDNAHHGNSTTNPISISSNDTSLRDTQISDNTDDLQPPRTPSPAPPPQPTLRPLSSPTGGPNSPPPLPPPTESPLDAFVSLPYQSKPPDPPPSSDSSTADIPVGFAALEAGIIRIGHSLADLYKPLTQSRRLEPFERGHWELTIPISRISTQAYQNSGIVTPWTPSEFVRFFHFFNKLIQEGRAGWDVWAMRDGVYYSIDGDTFDGHGTRRETVRFFCRGGLVAHVWLAMFTGNRKAVGLGAMWRDARDDIVVRMR
jgi:hypothetical protein